MGEPEGWPVQSVELLPQAQRQPPPSPVDLLEMAAAQQSCADCQKGATLPALCVLWMDVGQSRCWWTALPACCGLWCQRRFTSEFLTPCTTWLTQEPGYPPPTKPSPRPKSAVQPIAVPI
jgi:hypothetical protein